MCGLCVLEFPSREHYEQHVQGEQHQRALRDAGLEPAFLDRTDKLRDAIEQGTQDIERQHGIKITPGVHSAVGTINVPARVEFKVINDGNEVVTFTCGFIETRAEFTLPTTNFTIGAGGSQVVAVTLNPRLVGIALTALVFNFGTWAAFRQVSLETHSVFADPDIEDLKPKTPYSRPKRVPIARYDDIVRGEPVPPSDDDDEEEKDSFTRVLEAHYVPLELKAMTGQDALLEYLISKGFAETNGRLNLTPRTYGEIYAILLHIEELQLNEDIQRYSLHNQQIEVTSSGTRAWLDVPGLAEKRPSVQTGDRIYLSRTTHEDNSRRKEYEGYVHDIQQTRVLLGFGPAFAHQHFPAARYNARFTINRLTLRRMHQALKQQKDEHKHLRPGQTVETFLFPSSPILGREEVPEVKEINQSLNREQLSAVRHIVNRTQRDNFYVVFGPPGTGKTTTIIEAMKQILSHDSKAKLLCCAPSNEAADLLVEKLHPMPVADMKRVCAFQRSPVGVSEVVKKYVRVGQGKFKMPRVAAILKARVVVATCSTAAVLGSYGIAPDHFTHIFLDEAGYALEPEALVPFADSCNAARIIAGDPMQLGPIVRSAARAFGLDVSLLERMCKLPCYSFSPAEEFKATQGYNPRLITKLVRNYRSHPAIISLPSQLFYRDQLIASADAVERSSLCTWNGLPSVRYWADADRLEEGETIVHLPVAANNTELASVTAARTREFPIVFHAVEGKETREGTSPSFFNVAECEIVRDYINRLQTECKLAAKDIGVVTPYRMQSRKLRSLLKNTPEIKVGSIEEFQGQERRVILMSCVRSSPEYLNYDAKFNLGFVNNPKRLNVSITRAKQLLIVVGNPRVLATDDNWKTFIKFCKQHHGVTGSPLPPLDQAERVEELRSFANTLQNLTLQEEEDQPEPPGDF